MIDEEYECLDCGIRSSASQKIRWLTEVKCGNYIHDSLD